jgi:hypothetical protein
MDVFRAAMLALRFLLELCLLAALAYWGSQVDASTIVRILLAIGAPLAAIAVWGAFVAPKAPNRPGTGVWLAIQVVLFGAGVAGLCDAGQSGLAIALGAAVVANTAILLAMGALKPEPGVTGPDPRD